MGVTVATVDDLERAIDRMRRNPPPPKLALSVQEAMCATGAGETTVRRWVRDGLLPTVPHTNRVLIPVAALEEFVSSGSDGADLGSGSVSPLRPSQPAADRGADPTAGGGASPPAA